MISKFRDLFGLGLKYYFLHFYVVLGFGLVLITLINTLTDINFSIFFGNLTYTYLASLSLVYLIPTVVLSAILSALFVTLLIFLVRKDLLQEYRKVYVLEFLKKRVVHVFTYYLCLYFLLLIIYLLFVNTVVSFLIPLLSVIILVLTFYTTQAIVCDEKSVMSGLSSNFLFLKYNVGKTILLIIFFTIIYFIISLIGFYSSWGYIVSLILFNLFFYPFTEIIKTVFYLTKYEILRSYL